MTDDELQPPGEEAAADNAPFPPPKILDQFPSEMLAHLEQPEEPPFGPPVESEAPAPEAVPDMVETAAEPPPLEEPAAEAPPVEYAAPEVPPEAAPDQAVELEPPPAAETAQVETEAEPPAVEEPDARPRKPARASRPAGKPWLTGALVGLGAGALIVIVVFGLRMLRAPPPAEETTPVDTSPAVPTVTPSIPLKPRLSIPPPGEPPVQIDGAPATREDAAAHLGRHLAAEALGSRNTLRPLIGKAALGAISPPDGLSSAELATLAEDESRVLSRYTAFFAGLGENLGKGTGRASDLEYLEGAGARLAQGLHGTDRFKITKLALCRQVSSFGRYDAYPGNEFRQGTPQILVYAELDRFDPGLQADGRYVLRFTGQLSLFDASAPGGKAMQEQTVSVTDVSASGKRDFFVAQTLGLPATIPPGSYRLQVRITDQASGAVAESSLPLTITPAS